MLYIMQTVGGCTSTCTESGTTNICSTLSSGDAILRSVVVKAEYALSGRGHSEAIYCN